MPCVLHVLSLSHASPLVPLLSMRRMLILQGRGGAAMCTCLLITPTMQHTLENNRGQTPQTTNREATVCDVDSDIVPGVQLVFSFDPALFIPVHGFGNISTVVK